MCEYILSIITPVYNAQATIGRCCESLFAQTLKSIQYIFVIDGSVDDSLMVIQKTLDRFPNRKKDVIIIDRKENRGVAYSRQQGLEKALGEFVIHCDADDWAEKDMYESLYNAARESKADIACCGFYVDTPDGKELTRLLGTEYHLKFNISPIYGSLWNKMIRREVITQNGIGFYENINWGEDFIVSVQCQLLANKIVVVNRPYYHYVQNTQSITHNLTHNKCIELIQCGYKMEQFLREHDLLEDYAFELNYLKFQLKQYLIIVPEVYSPSEWQRIFPECHQDIMKYEAPLYLRISSWLIAHHLTPIASMILNLRSLINHYRIKKI